MDKKTNAKKSISPSKAANVNTVTALFKKQQEKAEQNKAETNGITCGKEQDSEDAVVFIKEEQSSYFKQKSVGRFSPVIDTYSMHRKDACTPTSAISGDFLRGENKKLSRRLSLRKADRESQILQTTHFSNEAHVTCEETVSISKKSAESFSVINVGKLHGAVDYQTVRKSSEVLSNCASQVFTPDDCVPSVSSDDFLGSQSAAVFTVQSSETLKLKKTENKNHPLLFKRSECPCFQKEIDLTSSVSGAQENSQKQSTFQKIEPKHMLKGKLSLKRKKSADESDLSVPCKSTLGTSKHEGKDVKAITKSDKESSDAKTEHSERAEAEGDAEQEEMHYLLPYYLENFRQVVKTVMEDEYYVHLFNEMDLKYVAAFNNLTEESQKLYIRLFSRKVAWLPMSKIKYLEIAEDLAPCLTELVTSYLINSDENLTDLSTVLGALSAPDLRTLSKSYHLNTTGQQKGQIIQTLVSKSQQITVASMFGQKTGSVAQSMLNRAKKVLGHIYRLLEEPRRVFIRTMMLFSLANTSGDEESGKGGQAQLCVS